MLHLPQGHTADLGQFQGRQDVQAPSAVPCHPFAFRHKQPQQNRDTSQLLLNLDNQLVGEQLLRLQPAVDAGQLVAQVKKFVVHRFHSRRFVVSALDGTTKLREAILSACVHYLTPRRRNSMPA
jgi:hypothetical protein